MLELPTRTAKPQFQRPPCGRAGHSPHIDETEKLRETPDTPFFFMKPSSCGGVALLVGSLDVLVEEALVEVRANGVVDEALLALVELSARLVLEHDVVVPPVCIVRCDVCGVRVCSLVRTRVALPRRQPCRWLGECKRLDHHS